jgi:phosphatidylglycerol:prolipoprotein diacylglycerol transferase
MLAHLPFHKTEPIDIGIPIHAFGVLVGVAIVVGTMVAEWRAKRVGVDPQHVQSLSMWALIPGFIGAHLYAVIAYEGWDVIKEDPLILIRIWEHISSFGGMIGGTLGTWYYVRKHNISFMIHADVLIYGFAFAWVFGRLACTVAFDHPGALTDSPLGMPFPYEMGLKDPVKFWLVKGEISTNIRHNLGFYEALWAVGMSLFYFTQRNKPHRAGWFLAAFVILYTPVRFLFDFLRVQDNHWWPGLTPGQYAAILLFVLGIWLLVSRRNEKEVLIPDGQVHILTNGEPIYVPEVEESDKKAPPKQSRSSNKKAKKGKKKR